MQVTENANNMIRHIKIVDKDIPGVSRWKRRFDQESSWWNEDLPKELYKIGKIVKQGILLKK